MFKNFRILIIIISIIIIASCKTIEKESIKDIKTYSELLDNNTYFQKDKEAYRIFKYYNNRLVAYNMLNNKLQIYDENKKLIKEFSNKGKGPGELINPTSIIYDYDGIFILDSDNSKIVWFDKDGNLKKDIYIKCTALKFTKVNKEIIVSSLGTFNYYLYIYNINEDKEPKEIIPKNNKYNMFDIKKIFADSYLISSISDNLYLVKMYEDSLSSYSLDGKLKFKTSRKLRNISEPAEIKKDANKIIMSEPLNLYIVNYNNNIYILTKDPKSNKNLVFEYLKTGVVSCIYELPFKVGMVEVIEKGKFLVLNENSQIISLTYKM